MATSDATTDDAMQSIYDTTGTSERHETNEHHEVSRGRCCSIVPLPQHGRERITIVSIGSTRCAPTLRTPTILRARVL